MNPARKRSVAARVGKQVKVSERALHPVGALPSEARILSSVARSTSSEAKRRTDLRARIQLSTSSSVGRERSFTGTESAGFLPSKVTAPTGHIARQCWQRMHLSGYAIFGVPSSADFSARNAQSRTHAPHFTHFDSSTSNREDMVI